MMSTETRFWTILGLIVALSSAWIAYQQLIEARPGHADRSATPGTNQISPMVENDTLQPSVEDKPAPPSPTIAPAASFASPIVLPPAVASTDGTISTRTRISSGKTLKSLENMIGFELFAIGYDDFNRFGKISISKPGNGYISIYGSQKNSDGFPGYFTIDGEIESIDHDGFVINAKIGVPNTSDGQGSCSLNGRFRFDHMKNRKYWRHFANLGCPGRSGNDTIDIFYR